MLCLNLVGFVSVCGSERVDAVQQPLWWTQQTQTTTSWLIIDYVWYYSNSIVWRFNFVDESFKISKAKKFGSKPNKIISNPTKLCAYFCVDAQRKWRALSCSAIRLDFFSFELEFSGRFGSYLPPRRSQSVSHWFLFHKGQHNNYSSQLDGTCFKNECPKV